MEDIRRILERYDTYLDNKDTRGAEKCLEFWLGEALLSGEKGNALTILNEQIGLYRNLSLKEKCFTAIDRALSTAEELLLKDDPAMGTTLINAATGYRAFNDAQRALPLYERAAVIYEKYLDPLDRRTAALYNNMAVSLSYLKRYDEAEASFRKAIGIMEKAGNGESEMAVSYCSMADMAYEQYGPLESDPYVNGYLEKAAELLKSPAAVRDRNFRFNCEKCLNAFKRHGWFAVCEEIEAQIH